MLKEFLGAGARGLEQKMLQADVRAFLKNSASLE